jgi:hypothetical protein|tara:strand:- start:292 stop:618 length:327 start_codon:yes stop_codon:yes gene_type:complete
MKQILSIAIVAIFLIACSDPELKKKVVGRYAILGHTYVFEEDGTLKIFVQAGSKLKTTNTWYIKRGKIYSVDESWSEKYRETTWKMTDNGDLIDHRGLLAKKIKTAGN